MEPLGAALSPSQASGTQGAFSTNEQRASSAEPLCQETAATPLPHPQPLPQTLPGLPAPLPLCHPLEVHARLSTCEQPWGGRGWEVGQGLVRLPTLRHEGL